MVFEDYIKENKTSFLSRLQTICSTLKINPEWLMIVMYAESRVNPQALNPITKAAGLIQFMPSTAVGLDTTTTALLQMDNVSQLDYVYKYYKPYLGKMNDVYDLYLATFFPAALGKADDYVLQTSTLSAELIAKQNAIIDINKDLEITVGEFKQYVDTYLKKKLKKPLKR